MNKPIFPFSLVASLMLFSGGAHAQTVSPEGVEEIRVVRSIRISRVKPTEFCAQSRTTFSGAQYEDQYSFAAVTTRSSDGFITDAVSSKVGIGHGCLGSADDSGMLPIYLEIELNGIRFVGIGKCTGGKSDFPEAGVVILACSANLSGLADPYIGGLLTTNTLISRKGGAESEPAGYVQASIATVRLWKRRETRSR